MRCFMSARFWSVFGSRTRILRQLWRSFLESVSVPLSPGYSQLTSRVKEFGGDLGGGATIVPPRVAPLRNVISTRSPGAKSFQEESWAEVLRARTGAIARVIMIF